jgi:hypothetical protein
MARKAERIGKLPPRYRFALNPHEARFSRCPKCERLTFPRKFPLLIHIEGHGVMVLGKTCPYCSRCEFIIAHQDELEAELTLAFSERAPQFIGNEYFVVGTAEPKAWQRAMKEKVALEEVLAHTADIKTYMEVDDPRPRWVRVEESPSSEQRTGSKSQQST